ncbi:MAG: pyrroline-5-carboxylate reductase [Planctomycetota bacterium]
MSKKAKLAVLGAGKLGEAILGGLFEAQLLHPGDVIATAAHRERLEALDARFPGVITTLDNRAAAADAEAVLLCVKPKTVPELAESIAGSVDPATLVITAAASVSTAVVERHLAAPVPVVRAMPNTPSLIRKGMTGIAPGAHAEGHHLAATQRIFGAVGRTVVVDERHMDAITGLSASGPAFLYIVIESLAEGGVKVGLPRDIATELAAQTVFGAGAMVLETGEHPARLKDAVTTPAGCTIDGILELEDGGLRVTLIKAIVQAAARASELLEG